MDSDLPFTTPTTTERSLLIPPHERLRFISLYVLATIASWLMATWILPLVQPFPGMASKLMQGLLTGATVGFAQWLVLRRYLPTGLWIATNAIGQFAVTLVSEGWLNAAIVQQQPNPQNLLELFVGYTMPLPITLLANLPVTLAQWLVLRRYIRSAGWWWLTPVGFSLLSLSFLLLNGLMVQISQKSAQFSWMILMPGLGGIVQASTLCLFRQKRGSLPVGAEMETGDRSRRSLLWLTVIVLLAVGGIAVLVGSLEILLLKAQMNI